MTVFLGFLAMSVGIMLCMLLPVWWLRKGQLKRLREFELHAPLLAEYAHSSPVVRCCRWVSKANQTDYLARFFCFCVALPNTVSMLR